jgi:hypothetical protein
MNDLRHPQWFLTHVEKYCTKRLNETANRLSPKEFTSSVTAEVVVLVRLIENCRANTTIFRIDTLILHGMLREEMLLPAIDLKVIKYILLILGHA